jgi:cation transport regulator ChaC
MWVFGYGSLMWDGWEAEHGYIRKVTAVLPRFRRAFDKGSVRNWGTKRLMGPTLNIVDDPAGECKGYAFEFPVEKRDAVVAALKKREGGFELKDKDVILDGGERVAAITPRYIGPNLIGDKPLAERAAMARVAVGTTGGKCADYVKGIVDKLAELRINDPAVQEFSAAMRNGTN